MKILFAGDWHGNYTHARNMLILARRQDCDRIFQVGDFGYWEHELDGVEYLDWLNEQCRRYGRDLYFLDGNHDKTSLLLERYSDRADEEGFLKVRLHIRYAPRGHRWTWGGTRFIALGGAYSVDRVYRLELEAQKKKPESYWFPEEEMTDEDMAKILLDASLVDVILAHDKPRASNPLWNRKDPPECLPNQDRLQLAVQTLRPSLFVHGHLHWRYSDTIRSGPDTYTKVEGLHCDKDATMHWPYDSTESWMIYTTKED